MTSLTVAAVLAGALPALAQRPVCPPLVPTETVRPACAAHSLFAAVRFLSEFGVDHLFKPSPPPFQKTLLDMARVFGGREISANPELEDFLSTLGSVRFSQLDRTTGTFAASFADGSRRFRGGLTALPVEPTLALELPPRLEGGYWRGPDVLQMAFWERHRLSLGVTIAGQATVAGRVQCLSLTPDGLLVRFEPGDGPPLLVEFRECEP